ncbi:MAG TPA: amylo-alpha-1,6-glucosidase [Chryseolinea sp.]|nr:amylo-alpha-1,6-glucosidase [Chryseolinea sp.]
MKFDSKTLSDFDKARNLEWLETNGLGGYASGTVSGAHSRRYHGLLVAALHPPVGRTVLLSKLDETIIVKSGDATKSYELASNQFPGAIHPHGYRYLTGFDRDIFPSFAYNAGGVEIKKTIACIHGENTTVILYEVVDSPGEFSLELLPLSSSRDFHSLCHANDLIGKHYLFDDGCFRTMNYPDGTEVFISVPGSEFVEQQGWYYNFEYSVEQYRGLEFQEDLFTHGRFSVTLNKGQSLAVIISTEDPSGRNALKLLAAEKKRREKLTKDFLWDESVKRLMSAADQFIVKRGDLSTIIAGYHWFADWGRDTMISLPGLCLAIGRTKEAKQILKQFADNVSDGMLPNRFPDYGEAPLYNTIDATLWFFHAIHAYYKSTEDKAFLKSIFSVLQEIVQWHYKGTRYNIKVDPEDELLGGGAEDVQLTWMDAKVGDWIVTPRRGKPVEINALWYNALRCMEFFAETLRKSEEASQYKTKAERVLETFNEKFWNPKQKYLYDYIDGSIRNEDLRPNQIYALSLPFPLLSGDRAKKVLQAVTDNLLTPRGLRTLANFHQEYGPAYGGTVWMRDGCYHQGTVWSYLLGPYVDALFYVKGEKAKDEAARVIKKFLDHLNEAGVGTVSEIFDADPPHISRGCIAQAWGVGEVLRVILKYNLLERPAVDQVTASLVS